MITPMLDARKRKVLEAVVDCYSRMAEPVSSRTIARHYGMSLSAATIRNTMADLEELGYLTQPHTSAGRIPTRLGYRVYVDNMMTAQELSATEQLFIQQRYAFIRRDFEGIMEQTSRILSEISHYIGIALSPELHESILRRLELIPIDDEKVLAVLLMTSGVVKNQVVSIPKDLSNEDLHQIGQILNEKLAGLSLQKIRQISQDPAQLKAIFDKHLSALIAAVTRDTFSLNEEIHVYLDGASNFFSQPEFVEVHKIEPLFRLLERKDQIATIMSPQQRERGIQVLIGSESGCEGMELCSVVRSSYRVQGEQFGTIGIIGPTRMEYPRVVSIVKFTAMVINQLFEEK